MKDPLSIPFPDQSACLDKIIKIFAQPITSCVFNDNGEDFFVVEINKEWIFRFPRREYSHQALMVEKRFLPVFQSMTSVPLPDYCFSLDDLGGYRKLPGDLLTTDRINNLSSKMQHAIARQLGVFLTALHSFPLVEARRLGVTPKWADWREKVSPYIYEKIFNDLPKAVGNHASHTLDTYFKAHYQPCVIHGDLSLPDHVLYMQGLNRISGIIDFGDLTIDSPAHDFLSIYEHGGEAFYRQVIEHYPVKDPEYFMGQIRFELSVRPIFLAAYYIETNQLSRYQEILPAIREIPIKS